LLEFRRGRGVTVVGTADQSAVLQRAQELVSYGRRHGYAPRELARIIEALS
jgi:GntR family transcriptional regulator